MGYSKNTDEIGNTVGNEHFVFEMEKFQFFHDLFSSQWRI